MMTISFYKDTYTFYGPEIDTTVILSNFYVWEIVFEAFGGFGNEKDWRYILVELNPYLKKQFNFDHPIEKIFQNKVLTKGPNQLRIIDLETMEIDEIIVEDYQPNSLYMD